MHVVSAVAQVGMVGRRAQTTLGESHARVSVLRRWWPAAAAAAAVSATARRLLFSATLVDLANRVTVKPDAASAFLGRRLDDLAYGAGLWIGAIRHQSWRCLQVRRPGVASRPAANQLV